MGDCRIESHCYHCRFENPAIMFDARFGYPLEVVTMLYSVSVSMSAFFQNNLLLRKACNATVPFGECTYGEANAQHVVSVIHSWKAMIQYTVPVVLIVLAGKSRQVIIVIKSTYYC